MSGPPREARTPVMELILISGLAAWAIYADNAVAGVLVAVAGACEVLKRLLCSEAPR